MIKVEAFAPKPFDEHIKQALKFLGCFGRISESQSYSKDWIGFDCVKIYGLQKSLVVPHRLW
ncbi:hypothetical protein ROE7235_03930 [Roseibaca ekhonensis]|uniref:Uncharacterized protein n=1 Tax=Roseinatronobacter ekhonensis TaxID=254356 RepID=A0A3B0MSX5_9RHOB|nr:hypothetical protein ROE7235_03930 [Roseibaca ekhonensis]